MSLQSWRIFGVSATIIMYIGGVLFLSMNNAPGSHPKRFSNFRNARFAGASSKMTIRWCTELKYLNTELPNRTVNAATQRLHSSTAKPIDTKSEYRVTDLTALASFPGSGNTWLRYLLQQATGILTGSIYIDYGLLKTGFPAENVRNNSVLLVKTHESGPKAWAPFSRAILLVRDPEKAILAEFNRQSGGHVGFASPERYRRTQGKFWQQFVATSLMKWETMNLNWAREFTGNIKVVFYEDLVNDLEKTLRSILNFLEFPINETLLHCALLRREGIFRRKKRLHTFDPFTPAMHTMLEKKKRIVYNMLGRFD